MFNVFVQAVVVVAVVFNSLFTLNVSHETRLVFGCIITIFSYISIFLSIYEIKDDDTKLFFGCMGCLLNQFARSYAEVTIVGYMKNLPMDMIMFFGMGQGTGSIYWSITRVFEYFGIWQHMSFVILAALVFPYFHFVLWIEDQRLFHSELRNEFRINLETQEHEFVQNLGHEECNHNHEANASIHEHAEAFQNPSRMHT